VKKSKGIWQKLMGTANSQTIAEQPAEQQQPVMAQPVKEQFAQHQTSALTFNDWIRTQVETEDYWFHRIELPGGLLTPGWNDPRTEKLPYFGLPDEMHGLRVLDIGHAEGFFSFEAERRGAAEVIGIENYPPMMRKFNTCRAALGSRAQSFRASVYDLDPRTFGTFDVVFFFGVLYHLRHPILALEKIRDVCTGTLLMQTATCSDNGEVPMAEFHPFGIKSGPPDNPTHDPTCFWFPNPACCAAMLEHVGFKQVERLSPQAPVGAVFSAQAPAQAKGLPPDETKAPWS
jgi:tRNA (mo5U34)-methyltransferase